MAKAKTAKAQPLAAPQELVTVWVWDGQPETDYTVGFVQVAASVAAEMIAEGRAQDPGVGATHLNYIERTPEQLYDDKNATYLINGTANPATGVVADGVAKSVITVTVTRDGDPLEGEVVDVTVDSATAAVSAPFVTTGTDGTATVEVTDTLGAAASETVTVTLATRGQTRAVTVGFANP